mmetsp:Transcript_10106/g.19070  ORF Transcript_10106/g.19070 Transcript_10106/m.19070 type:complete len:681 (+) Transcript_10106:148-2190(+)|eukprot:CAMPEP_0114231054 /NCGR_PEP_ID=MMETSP0058-20121206/3817_1 /TAXON_ID=36894 /ORGANISM="Pyramimonas parkeae, CCMP726" /LENGTH=680 /DNA_ID=CAMNT_0001342333 /DNA_START=108 /DNA_END=2150 /DNA_ORIENTATION=-
MRTESSLTMADQDFAQLCHRVVVHCDLDCFYCQVEHKRLNVPTDVPLAVQQWHGLIAVNYAARGFGIKRGMRIAEAKRLCAGLMCVHVETIGTNSNTSDTPDRLTTKVSLERYRRAGASVFDVFQRFFPRTERASIDEAFLDITAEVDSALAQCLHQDTHLHAPEPLDLSHSNVFGGALDPHDAFDRRLAVGGALVAQLRAAVQAETGFTVSAGVAHNKMVAKLASARHKPDKQTIVPWRAVPEMMRGMPLRSVRGLGGKLGEAVETVAGERLTMVSDLLELPCSELLKRFDEKTVRWLQRVARGIDDGDVVPNLIPKSLNACKSFAPIGDIHGVEAWMKVLASELVERMTIDQATHNRRAKSLVVHFRGSLNASHLKNWEAGRTAELTGEQSRQTSMPSSKPGSAPHVDTVLEAAMRLFRSGLPNAMPCTRLSIGAVDFQPLPSASKGSINNYFHPSNVPVAEDVLAASVVVKSGVCSSTSSSHMGIHRYFQQSQSAASPSADALPWYNMEADHRTVCAKDHFSISKRPKHDIKSIFAPKDVLGKAPRTGCDFEPDRIVRIDHPTEGGSARHHFCQKCGTFIEEGAAEHQDYHMALDLQKYENNERRVGMLQQGVLKGHNQRPTSKGLVGKYTQTASRKRKLNSNASFAKNSAPKSSGNLLSIYSKLDSSESQHETDGG